MYASEKDRPFLKGLDHGAHCNAKDNVQLAFVFWVLVLVAKRVS